MGTGSALEGESEKARKRESERARERESERARKRESQRARERERDEERKRESNAEFPGSSALLGHLRRSWADFGRSWPVLARFGARLGLILGPPWAHLGPSWAHFRLTFSSYPPRNAEFWGSSALLGHILRSRVDLEPSWNDCCEKVRKSRGKTRFISEF